MALSITEALELLDRVIQPLSTEIIPIEDSLGRIVASDYTASFNLPRYDNSAMDGYAVKVSDRGKTVKSDKNIYAGDESLYTLQPSEAIRIMTGAPIPKGCEAIVPIENVTINGEEIGLPEDIRPGTHIRHSGEDIQKGDRYIKMGDSVTAYTIALFASQGITHISTRRRVRVAVFGTGDELRPHYEKIESYQLYNSNAPMFIARAKELGCEVSYIGGSSDTIDSLKLCIEEALDADLVITSGGVSMGDKDFTKESFTQLGMKTLFSGVNIKPGKPTTIGTINRTVIVNLPGNPLAAMVNYELFISFIMRKLSGTSAPYHGILNTVIDSDYTIKAGKYTTILGRFDGRSFTPLPQQSPGMVSPLQMADGMIIADPSLSILKKGAEVSMLPIKWQMSSASKREIFTK